MYWWFDWNSHRSWKSKTVVKGLSLLPPSVCFPFTSSWPVTWLWSWVYLIMFIQCTGEERWQVWMLLCLSPLCCIPQICIFIFKRCHKPFEMIHSDATSECKCLYKPESRPVWCIQVLKTQLCIHVSLDGDRDPLYPQFILSLLLRYTQSLCRCWLHRDAVICKDWVARGKKELKLNQPTVKTLSNKSTGKKYNILQPSSNTVFMQYIFLEASERSLLSL